MFTVWYCESVKDILVDREGLETHCTGVNPTPCLDQHPTHVGSYTMCRTVPNLVTPVPIDHILPMVGHTCWLLQYPICVDQYPLVRTVPYQCTCLTYLVRTVTNV